MKCPSCQSGDVVRARDSGFTICYNCGCKELTANFLEIGDKIKRDDIGIYPCDDKELTYEETQAIKITDTYDMINPSHYSNMKISPIEYVEANPHLTWSLSNAIKYISRAGLKPNNSRLQDMKKALWYLQHEIELEEANEVN